MEEMGDIPQLSGGPPGAAARNSGGQFYPTDIQTRGGRSLLEVSSTLLHLPNLLSCLPLIDLTGSWQGRSGNVGCRVSAPRSQSRREKNDLRANKQQINTSLVNNIHTQPSTLAWNFIQLVSALYDTSIFLTNEDTHLFPKMVKHWVPTVLCDLRLLWISLLVWSQYHLDFCNLEIKLRS